MWFLLEAKDRQSAPKGNGEPIPRIPDCLVRDVSCDDMRAHAAIPGTALFDARGFLGRPHPRTGNSK